MRSVLAGLDVVTVQQSSGAPSAVVVLCHGFGAPGTDLVGLASALVQLAPSLATVRFHFPAGPVSLRALGLGDGRAWWMIDFEVLAQLRQARPEAVKAFRRDEPAGMPAARKALSALVNEALVAAGLGFDRLVVGGFSQGAMVTTDVALRLEEAPRGLAILSGTLLTEDTWAHKARARAGLNVFQSHGRFDEVLSFDAALGLQTTLRDAGCVVDFVPFEGGHDIPPVVVKALAAFLTARLGA